MTFDEFYNIYKNKINKELSAYLTVSLKQAKKISNDNFEFTRTLSEYILRDRGKRLRGLLIILGYLGQRGRNEKEIIKAAAFMELVHCYLLIHDDIIDRDDFRRGGNSLHKEYRPGDFRLSELDRIHFGYSLAIVAGDLCNDIGQNILNDAVFPAKNKILAQKKRDEMLYNVIQGEALDIILQSGKDFNFDAILKVYKYKTAYYTFTHPMQIGAILAGAAADKLKNIEKFSIPLGVAFQIQDDILGLFGDQKTIGKPIGNDLREGKKTLILFFGLEMCSANDKKFIKSLVGKKDLRISELNKAREILIECGAVEKCEKLIQKYFKASKKELRKLDLAPEPKKLLFELIDFINHRKH